MFKRRQKKNQGDFAELNSRNIDPTSLDGAMFETLEQRVLLSVSLDSGVLTITGSDAGDDITVSVSADNTVVVAGDPDAEDGTFENVESINIDTGEGTDSITINGDDDENDRIKISEDGGDTIVKWRGLSKITATLGSVETLVVNTLGGNDRVTATKLGGSDLASSETLVINGGDDKDNINARRAGIDVVLNGGDGDDRLSGGEGNDVIDGGEGKDRINGGNGNDDINGGAGDDRIAGGNGNDEIDGDAGKDRINGGKGNDDISGGDGDDRIIGGAGDDDLEGDAGADRLNGGGGEDEIEGGDGEDRLKGGGGEDILQGGADADRINGGGGRDIILGIEPADKIRGGKKDLLDPSFAELEGENVVPAVETDAEGFALIVVEEDDTLNTPSILFDLELDGIDIDGNQTPDDESDDLTGLHVHRGAAGENGPHVFDIITEFNEEGEAVSDDLDDLEIDAENGTIISIWDGDEAHGEGGSTVSEILAEEDSEFYLVVHTTGNPDGEIRGQIEEVEIEDDDEMMM